MTYGVTNYSFNAQWNYNSSNGNGYQANCCPQQRPNPQQMMQGMAMIFAGMDMLDDGQINGSILQKLMGGQQNQQAQQCPPPPPPPPPPQQQQNQQQQGMMQMMMQMMMMMMQMLMQMMGMGQNQNQQCNNGNQAYAQAGNGNAFAQAGNGGAMAAAGNGNAFAAAGNGNAFAAAGAGNGNSFAFAGAGNIFAGGGNQINIAASSRGEWGDPHFNLTGKDGKAINFDHKGVSGNTYNLFQGDNLQVVGKYEDYKDPKNPQIVGETAVKAGNDVFKLTKDGKASINGQDLNIKDGQEIQLQDGTKIKRVNGKEYQVTSNDGDGKVNIKAEGGGGMAVDPEGNFSNPGGIIGTAIDQNRALTKEECDKFNMGVVL